MREDSTTSKTSFEKRWLGVAVLSIILVIISIDNSVLDIALPAISNDLGASAKELQWLIDIYILTFTALLLTMGALSDRYGRFLLLQMGLVLFAAASLGAALATTISELITYRGLSGVGAAMMMPSTLSIITDMFEDKNERQKAIAVWGAMFGVGFTVGPLLGGWIVDHYGWPWVFYINIPIGIMSFILGFMWLRESKDTTTPKADFMGMFLSVIAMFSLIYAIIEAGMIGWSATQVHSYFGIAFIFTLGFIAYERKTPHAMLPLGLFKNRSFWVASVSVTMSVFAIMGTMFFFSQLLQTVQSYDAFTTGLMLLGLTAGMMPASTLAPKLVARLGITSIVTIGLLIASISMFYFAFTLTVDVRWWHMIVGFVLLGVGFGLAMVPATNSIMGAIPEEKLGVGSAMNDTTRELGGALSIALLGALVNNHYIQAIRNSSIDVSIKERVASSIQNAHLTAQETIITLADHIFVEGLVTALHIGAWITLASALLAWGYLPSRITQSKLEDL